MGFKEMVKAPFIAGPAGVSPPTLPVPPCVACGTSGSAVRVPLLVVDSDKSTLAVVVCLDGHECGVRYRHGASPEAYANNVLRGVAA